MLLAREIARRSADRARTSPTDPLAAFGAEVASLYVVRGWSQHALAQRSGVSQSSISRLINGKAPGMGIATVVRRTVDSVVTGVDSVLGDESERRRLAVAGPAFVNARYTWDAIIPDVIAQYETVIARAGRSPAGDS